MSTITNLKSILLKSVIPHVIIGALLLSLPAAESRSSFSMPTNQEPWEKAIVMLA